MLSNTDQSAYPSVPEMGYHLIMDFCGIETVDLDNMEEVNNFAFLFFQKVNFIYFHVAV